MNRLLLASGNKGKLKELRAMLAPLGVEVVGLEDFPNVTPVEEVGRTFFENALIKALGYANQTGLPALADDSGLEVEALGGRPGVASARWAGEPCDDARNNAKLIAQLASSGAPRPWRARYACALVLMGPTPGPYLCSAGFCEGEIIPTPAGSGGFGYDPYFYLPQLGMTLAQTDPETKNRLSHRGKALAALRDGIIDFLRPPIY